jgi:hypothetical protein
MDIDEHLLIGSGQHIDPRTQRHQPAQDRFEVAGMSKVNCRNNVPTVKGAYTP